MCVFSALRILCKLAARTANSQLIEWQRGVLTRRTHGTKHSAQLILRYAGRWLFVRLRDKTHLNISKPACCLLAGGQIREMHS